MVKNKSYSLYLALGLIIFTIVIAIMSVNLTFTYVNTKNDTVKNMKERSRETILSLKDSLKTFIASYAVNEYNNLIYNEISRKDIFAIVVEDYNMGKIFGKKSHFSGKIKNNAGEIIKFDSKNLKHLKDIKNSFYSETFSITSNSGEKLGNISIYITDKKMKKDLDRIIIENVKNSLILSLFLITFLFISIRIFILKPISDIIETIGKRDEEGIPLKSISNVPIVEIDKLAFSINKMINSIKKSRKIQKKEQNRLEYLLELSPIAVRIAKNHGENVIFANNAYSKLLNLNKNQTLHKNPKSYYTHEEQYNQIINSLEHNKPISNKLVSLTIEGSEVWALASYMNIDFDGEPAIIGWFYDVTNEKNNENRLFKALELQTTIFDNSGYLIIRTDEKGVIKQLNKEAQKILAYEPEELIDKHTPEILHIKEEIEQRAKELSKELKKEIPIGFKTLITKADMDIKDEKEWTYLTKKGKHIPVILSVTALRDKNNSIYGYIGISRDITQSKLMESQTKLASMGEMIGNIAHQWRQPLSVISTVSSGIKVKSEFGLLNEDELLSEMDTVTLQAQYLSKTIDDFRDFIKDKNDKEKTYISKVIEKTMSIINSTMANNDIQVIIDTKDDLIIDAYENQLVQAFINILNNSKDAINDSIKDSTSKLIFIKTKRLQNGLLLTIKDNGGGIHSDVIEKVFDPYFTTKHQSIGTGIGLSMTYQIITEHHNASIKILNEVYEYEGKRYKGATSEIFFKE